MKKFFLIAGIALSGYLCFLEWEAQFRFWNLKPQVVQNTEAEAKVSAPEEKYQLPKPREQRVERSPVSVEVLHAHEPMSKALEVAFEYLQEHQEQWNLQAHHQFKGELMENPLGKRVVFRVEQEGVPVLGLSIAIDLSNDLEVTGTENHYRPVQKADLSEKKLAPSEIARKHRDRWALETVDAPEYVLFVPPTSDEPVVGYSLSIAEGGKAGQSILFRARDGQVLSRGRSRSEF